MLRMTLPFQAIERKEGIEHASRFVMQSMTYWSRNQGFDGVWVRRGADGRISQILITESKFNSNGQFILSKLKNGTMQMSDDWLEMNIGRMMTSQNQALIDTAILLRTNMKLIQLKGALLTPNGVLRFHNIARFR